MVVLGGLAVSYDPGTPVAGGVGVRSRRTNVRSLQGYHAQKNPHHHRTLQKDFA